MISHLPLPRRALTSALAVASEAVGFFAIAQPVDEGAELPHVPHPPRHHHLLLDDVSLRKVGPSLQEKGTRLSESLEPSVEVTLQTGRWERAVLHAPSPTGNRLRPGFQQRPCLTLTLTSSSHRFLGGITMVVLSSLM